MPQWAGSCWYYLRFTDPANADAFASPEALNYWGVPDLYVGGAEHAVLHLLYARFWHKVLFDLGVAPQAEPAKTAEADKATDAPVPARSTGGLALPQPT